MQDDAIVAGSGKTDLCSIRQPWTLRFAGSWGRVLQVAKLRTAILRPGRKYKAFVR
jgi:hypothetical protein